MAGRIAYYGNIVKDGLVLDLDAAKKDSYPGSGTVWRDVSGNGNTGTLTNGPTFNNANGGGIVFDGVDDYGDIPNNSTLNISTSITLEAWIFATSNNTTQNVICKSSNSQNTGYIYPRTNDGWVSSSFYIHSGVWSQLAAPWPSKNAWHHTAATYDGSTMIIYINGVQAASKLQTGAITTNTNNLSLGQQPGYANEYYGGRIGNAKVYNRALSATEVLQNYNALKGRYGL